MKKRGHLNPLRLLTGVLYVLLVTTFFACAAQSNSVPRRDRNDTQTAPGPSALNAAKDELWNQLADDPAFLGVGVGASKSDPNAPSIMVYISKGAPKNLVKKIPPQVNGISTTIVFSDKFKAYDSEQKSQTGTTTRVPN